MRSAAAVTLALVVLVACGGNDDDRGSNGSSATTTAAAAAAACPNADGSSARTTSFAQVPPMCITPGKTYTAEVTTTKGSFTIALDPSQAPATVNNFVVLSRYHYYDGVLFHRIIPGFVVQGGDPLGTGGGGPGYTFDDELPRAGQYKIGSVAMANSGPGTNGSQFFIVTGDRGAALPPNYALFGTVTSGMEVVQAIEATGTSGGRPTDSTTITAIKITES
ncbi:MAG: peptidylprolyl isomerase [Acidimicrobiales bacterium]